MQTCWYVTAAIWITGDSWQINNTKIMDTKWVAIICIYLIYTTKQCSTDHLLSLTSTHQVLQYDYIPNYSTVQYTAIYNSSMYFQLHMLMFRSHYCQITQLNFLISFINIVSRYVGHLKIKQSKTQHIHWPHHFRRKHQKKNSTKNLRKQIMANGSENQTHLRWRRHAPLYTDYCDMYESH